MEVQVAEEKEWKKRCRRSREEREREYATRLELTTPSCALCLVNACYSRDRIGRAYTGDINLEIGPTISPNAFHILSVKNRIYQFSCSVFIELDYLTLR